MCSLHRGAHAHLGGHPYTLDKQRCTNSVRQSFL